MTLNSILQRPTYSDRGGGTQHRVVDNSPPMAPKSARIMRRQKQVRSKRYTASPPTPAETWVCEEGALATQYTNAEPNGVMSETCYTGLPTEPLFRAAVDSTGTFYELHVGEGDMERAGKAEPIRGQCDRRTR